MKHKCGQCDKFSRITVNLGTDKRYLCKEHYQQHNNCNKEFFPVFVKASEIDWFY